MADNYTTIILKNSQGVDKVPLLSDLTAGELAVNTVTGTLFTKVTTSEGELIYHTDLRNYENVTTTPIVTVPLSANEGDIVDIQVTPHSSTAYYKVIVSAGIVDASVYPFKWHLPAVLDDTTLSCSVSATEQGKLESAFSPNAYIEVTNTSGDTDDTLVLNGVDMVASNFETLTNSSIDSDTVLVTADNAEIETIDFEQDSGQTDWSQYQTEVKVLHKDIADLSTTAPWKNGIDELCLKSEYENSINTGDHIYTVDENNKLQERQISGVETRSEDWHFVSVQSMYTYRAAMAVDNQGRLWGIGNCANFTMGFSCGGNHTEWFNIVTPTKVKIVRHLARYQNYSSSYISDTGNLYQTGYFHNGGAGNGTTDTNPPPLTTWTLNTYVNDVIEIYSTDRSTIVLCADGNLYGTGYNTTGKLGLGHINDVYTFTNLTQNIQEKVISFGASDSNVIFITETGDVYVAGDNYRGQLGDGTTDSSSVFLKVPNVTGKHVPLYQTNNYHTLVFFNTNDTLMYCGEKEGVDYTSDTKHIFTDSGYTGIDHRCSRLGGTPKYYLVNIDNTVIAKGGNNSGSLGVGIDPQNGDPVNNWTVVPNILATSCTDHITDAYDLGMFINIANDTLYYAGYDYGWVGGPVGGSFAATKWDPAYTRKFMTGILPRFDSTHEDITITTTYPKMAIGGGTSLKIETDGTLWARGDNTYGQLGLGDLFKTQPTESPVSFLQDVVKITVYEQSSGVFFLDSNNNFYYRGKQQNPILDTAGVDTVNNSYLISADVTDFYLAFGGCTFKKTDNSWWFFGVSEKNALCFGNNGYETHTTPVELTGLPTSVNFVKILPVFSPDYGQYIRNLFFLDDNGKVYVSGFNKYYAIDSTNDSSSNSIVEQTTLSGTVVDIIVFGHGEYGLGNNSCLFYALMSDNTLQVKGVDAYGAAGTGSMSTDITDWTPINGVTNVSKFIDDVVGSAYQWVYNIFYYIGTDGYLYYSGTENSGNAFGLGNTATFTNTNKTANKIYSPLSVNTDNVGGIFLYEDGGNTYVIGGNHSLLPVMSNSSNKYYIPISQDISSINTYYYSFDVSTSTVSGKGSNQYNLMGIGDPAFVQDWTQVPDTYDVLGVYVGNYMTAIIKTDNSVWTVGRNCCGQLGLGNIQDYSIYTNTGIKGREVIFASSVNDAGSSNPSEIFVISPDNILYFAGQNNARLAGLGDIYDIQSFVQSASNVVNFNIYEYNGSGIAYYTNTSGEAFYTMKNMNNTGLSSTYIWKQLNFSKKHYVVNVVPDTLENSTSGVSIKILFKSPKYEPFPNYHMTSNSDSNLTVTASSTNSAFPGFAVGWSRWYIDSSWSNGGSFHFDSNGTQWLKIEASTPKTVYGFYCELNLVAWYDAVLYVTFQYSTDGGSTWIDIGSPHYMYAFGDPILFIEFDTPVTATLFRLYVTNNKYNGIQNFVLLTNKNTLTPEYYVGVFGNMWQGNSPFPRLYRTYNDYFRVDADSTPMIVFENTEQIYPMRNGGVIKTAQGDYKAWRADSKTILEYGTINMDDTGNPVKLGVSDDTKYLISPKNAGTMATFSNYISNTDDNIYFCGKNINNYFVTTGNNIVTYTLLSDPNPNYPYEFTKTTITLESSVKLPLKVYKKSLSTYTSMTDTAGDSYVLDEEINSPSVWSDGLVYTYKVKAQLGRFLSTKLEGLVKNERVIYIKNYLERLSS